MAKFMERLKQINWALLIGIVLVSVVFLITFVSIFYTPYDPIDMVINNRLAKPSLTNPLGTDQYGRDVLSRVMIGGQITLLVGLSAVLLGMVVGVFLGALAGYYGGLWDEVLMRIADGLYSFPAFLLALLAVTLLGPGQNTALAAIAVANVPVFMRITRSNFLSLRETNFVEAARAMGATDFRIIAKHLLPNTLPALLVQASVSFAIAVLAEASLSFLGVGTQPPDVSWGRMLKDSQAVAGIAPWTILYPGLAIGITVLGFNLLGDGLQGK